jgi:signal transduction histidine kinase
MMAEPDELSSAEINDIRSSIAVIQRRGEGLLDFTETYRSLTRIPPPNFQLVEAEQLLKDAEQLFRSEAEERGIELIVHLPPSPISLQGDPHLLEQVLINLVKNAMDAVAEVDQPQVHLHLNRGNDGRALIQVADNGQGMAREQLEQIFVPFFTTKDEGSGIGLSLSRQIMRLHKGSIEVQSVEGEGTVMSLLF